MSYDEKIGGGYEGINIPSFDSPYHLDLIPVWIGYKDKEKGNIITRIVYIYSNSNDCKYGWRVSGVLRPNEIFGLDFSFGTFSLRYKNIPYLGIGIFIGYNFEPKGYVK